MSKPRFSLAGDVIIVTGGRRAIGKAIAFAEVGGDVAVCDLVTEDGELDKVIAQIKALGGSSLAIRTDVSNKNDLDDRLREVIEQFDTIDILINNAGIIIRAPILDLPKNDWERRRISLANPRISKGEQDGLLRLSRTGKKKAERSRV